MRDRDVKCVGLNMYGRRMVLWNERVLWNGTKRKTLQCMRGGMMAAWLMTFSFELYRAQGMDVNERNYRWSESRSKVCQMCDMGEDEWWSM